MIRIRTEQKERQDIRTQIVNEQINDDPKEDYYLNYPHSDTQKGRYQPPGLINSLFDNKYNHSVQFNASFWPC